MTTRREALSQKDEDRMIAAVEGAVFFQAALFVGTGQYRTEKRATVMSAVRAGRIMEAIERNGRRHIVYAVSPHGSSVMLTPGIIERMIARVEQG